MKVKMIAFTTQHMKDNTKRVTIKMRIPEDHEYVAIMPVRSRKSVSLVYMRYLQIKNRAEAIEAGLSKPKYKGFSERRRHK